MKIAYLCYWDLRSGDGVADKIGSQVAHWRAAGHEVELFYLTSNQASAASKPGREFTFQGFAARVMATRRLTSAVRAWHPDLVYLRYDLFVPPVHRALGDARVIAELNSNVQAELKARSSLAAWYESRQRRLLLSRLDGLVAVTHELAQEVDLVRPGLRSAVIANGIELGSDEPRRAGAAEPPHLVYLGENVYWQGIDKVYALAEAHPEWQFDLIGPAPGASSPKNVTCHGYLQTADYSPLLHRADVAIGTLALHRKRMDEACPLKVRRYLAYGLPVILGYRDTDLDAIDKWWLLRLPNTESNVISSLPEIEAFVETVRGRRVPRDEIEPLISAAAKEAARLAFFEEVVSTPG
jgi:hypothetical protein